MLRYVLKRLLTAIPTLFVVVTLSVSAIAQLQAGPGTSGKLPRHVNHGLRIPFLASKEKSSPVFAIQE